MASALSKNDILDLLRELNKKLQSKNVSGEVNVVGGAVMCLVFQARPATKDIDALFVPKTLLLDLVGEIARERSLPNDWLNDAVKSYLSEKGSFESYLELSHLKVMVPTADYLLAMKCLAMRLGPGFHDENDVRYLLRYLNIESYEEAKTTIAAYYPIEKFPQKTLYALEEILEKN